MRSPYKILGIEPSAKDADIKSAYRKLAKVWHPDQNSDDPNASDVFAEINNAYNLLIDPPRRKLFDSGKIDPSGRRRRPKTVVNPGVQPSAKKKASANTRQDDGVPSSKQAGADTPDNQSSSDFKKAHKEGASTVNAASKAKSTTSSRAGFQAHKDASAFSDPDFNDMVSHIFGTPEERAAYDQTSAEEARRNEENFHKDALNELDDAFVKFQKNQGSSKSLQQEKAPDRYYLVEIDLADIFTGATVPIQPERNNSLNVHIPAGTLEGAQIVIEGLAECRKGEVAGDIYVTVKYRPNEKFWVRNGELHTYLAVNLADAVLGGEVTTETPEGPVTFNLPEWTSSHHIIRIPNRGLPTSPGKRGDLCANVCILLPEQPNEVLRRAMQTTRKSWFV